jgi:hypothetical protein
LIAHLVVVVVVVVVIVVSSIRGARCSSWAFGSEIRL